MGIVLPLLGEVTALRAFFLFLFFYSNDSNSMSTWSTFGAGMLLSNLGKRPSRMPLNTMLLLMLLLLLPLLLLLRRPLQQRC
jgi:hypothetical protein